MVQMMAMVRICTFYRITHRRFRSLPFKRRQLEGVPRCAHTVLSLSVHAPTGRVRAQRRVCMGRWANSNGAHTLLARRFAQAAHGYATALCACQCSGFDLSERAAHAYYAQMVCTRMWPSCRAIRKIVPRTTRFRAALYTASTEV